MIGKRYAWLIGGVLLILFAASCRATELRRIGVAVPDLGNPFFVRLARGVETAAQRLAGPGVRVDVASSAFDLQRQIAQIDRFIRKKVDFIILAAVDPAAIEPAVRRAQAAGIPVVAVDLRASGADATVATDNVRAGDLACAYLAQRLKGRGNVVIVNGPPVSSVIERVEGCLGQLRRHPGIVVLSADRDGGGSLEGGFARMTDLLTLYPHIDAVFAINDMTALGVERAALQAGRSELAIVGVDGSPRVRARLRAPNALIVASVAQLPGLMAEKAVQRGYALLHKSPSGHDVELIPAALLTREQGEPAGLWNE